MINVKHGIGISRYNKLKSLLKRFYENYVPKIDFFFTDENVREFVKNDPDYI